MATILEHLVPNIDSTQAARVSYALRSLCGEVGAQLASQLEQSADIEPLDVPGPGPGEQPQG